MILYVLAENFFRRNIGEAMEESTCMVVCKKCGKSFYIWFAICPRCGKQWKKEEEIKDNKASA
jgi:uncharacterized OB-fold protein